MGKRHRRRRDYVLRDGLLLPANEEDKDMPWYSGLPFFTEMDDDNARKQLPPGAPGAPKQSNYETYDEWKKSHGIGGHSTGNGGGQQKWRSCDHVQDMVYVGDLPLLLTGAHDVTSSELDKMQVGKQVLSTPDLGIYLTNEWKYKMELPKPKLLDPDLPAMTAYGNLPSGIEATLSTVEAQRAEHAARKAEMDKQAAQWRWPFLLVEWPDQGVINVEVAATLVGYILKQMQAGKVVDMGCAGAHGRTGTLLAMMLIEAEHMEPEQAIRETRQRHCRKAIESARQVRAIFGFGGKVATEEEVKRLS